MISPKSLAIEYKVGAVTGLTALLLSFLVGLVAGNEFLYTIGRAFFFGVLLALMGFGGVLILKKFAPEVFLSGGEVGSGRSVDASENVEVIADDVRSSSAPESGADTESVAVESAGDAEPSKDFEPLGEYYKRENGTEHLETPERGNGSVKMGRHLLAEKKIKYEPKIIASAIRTMMNKDQ